MALGDNTTATVNGVKVDGFLQANDDVRQTVTIGAADNVAVAGILDGSLVTTNRDITATGTVTAADAASATATSNPLSAIPGYTQTRYTGTPTAGSAVALMTPAASETSFSFDISGTFVGTLQLERTVDGTTWTSVGAFVAGSPITAQTFTAPVACHGNDSSTAGIRLRATAWTSGSATVFIRSGPGVGTVTMGNPARIADAANPTQGLSVSSTGAAKVARTIDLARTRVTVNYSSTAPVVADTLLSVSLNKAGTVTTVTTVPVTAGKVLRFTSVVIGLRATAATLPYGLVTLRVNDAGAAVIGSNAVAQIPVSGNAAAIGNTGTTTTSIEDGLELTGTQQLGVSFSNNVTTNVATISLVGYEYTA